MGNKPQEIFQGCSLKYEVAIYLLSHKCQDIGYSILMVKNARIKICNPYFHLLLLLSSSLKFFQFPESIGP